SLVLIGIVLRGSAFTFWRYGGGAGGGHGSETERHWGVVFAIASLITPLLLGTTVGSIASGALGEGGRGKGEGFCQVYVGPWLRPCARPGSSRRGPCRCTCSRPRRRSPPSPRYGAAAGAWPGSRRRRRSPSFCGGGRSRSTPTSCRPTSPSRPRRRPP